MEMIVPGIENIQTEQQRLDGSITLMFKEEGTERRFPAHLVSDGTMYALCLLVAVIGTPSQGGMTLIEEPERGLHAKAIRELVHRGKRDYPYQSYLRLSLRHGFSRNPEGFAIHVYMGHNLRHDALVDMMRQQASPKNPLWLTTHSESVVHALKLSELILVDKIDGRTTMKRADAVNLSEEDMAPLGLDEVWLSNLLGGGLPW